MLRADHECACHATSAQENLILIGQKVTEEQIAKQNAAAAAEAEAMAAKRQEEADRAQRLASWKDDEIRLLEKALVKFPVVRVLCSLREQSLRVVWKARWRFCRASTAGCTGVIS